MSASDSAIFFDAAGTLFELAEPVGHTYARAACRHGLTIPPDAVDAAFRRAWKACPAPLHPVNQPPEDDDRQWWHRIVTHTLQEASVHPVPKHVIEPVFSEVYDHYALATAWRLFDDVGPALDRLQHHATLHLLSNFDSRLLSIVQGLGIASYFATTTVSSRIGASKPHPRIFESALSSAGVTPERALHVGDESIADGEGARNAGMRAYLVNRPSTSLLSLAEKIDNSGFSSLHRSD